MQTEFSLGCTYSEARQITFQQAAMPTMSWIFRRSATVPDSRRAFEWEGEIQPERRAWRSAYADEHIKRLYLISSPSHLFPKKWFFECKKWIIIVFFYELSYKPIKLYKIYTYISSSEDNRKTVKIIHFFTFILTLSFQADFCQPSLKITQGKKKRKSFQKLSQKHLTYEFRYMHINHLACWHLSNLMI